MTQLDDVQAFANENFPLRAITYRATDPLVSYDGDPNSASAPDILKTTAVGTFYLRATPALEYRKMTSGATGWVIGGSGGLQHNTEAIELSISLTGTDPVPGDLTVTEQAQADDWGDFRTISGAVSAIPNTLLYDATLRLPAGAWLLDDAQMGDIARVRPTATGTLHLAGDDSWVQVAGTPVSMAVTSSDGAGNVTLASDPGLAANAFKGYYLLVLSGTGAGQYKPLRTHSGTSMTVAGEFSGGLDATSVVRISKRATTLEMNNSNSLQLSGSPGIHASLCGLNFSGLNIIPNSLQTWWSVDTQQFSICLSSGTRWVEGGFFGGMSNLSFEDCIIDVSNGFAWEAVLAQGGLVRTNWGSSRPMLLLGDGTTPNVSAIRVGCVGSNTGLGVGAGIYIFGSQAFDGWTRSYVYTEYEGTSLYLAKSPPSPSGVFPKTDQAADYAIFSTNSAKAYLPDVAGFGTSTFKGSINDFNLDGTVINSWANLDLATDKVLTSSRGTSIMED